MKKTIYLHIGTFKTGTSSVQTFLAQNYKELEACDYFVPRGELIFQHVIPISLIKDYTNFRSQWYPTDKPSKFYLDELKKQLSETKCNNIIISSEIFCDFVHPQVGDASLLFKNLMGNLFCDYDVKVLCYLREIDNYIMSMYKECVKLGGMKLSFLDFLTKTIVDKSFHAFPSKFLDFYADIFGRDSLILRKYNKKDLLNMDVVPDFLKTIGCEIQISEKTISANKSLTNESALLKVLFNRVGFADENFHRYISDALIAANEINIAQKNDYAIILEEAEKIKNIYGVSLVAEDKLDFNFFDKNLSDVESFFCILVSTIVKQNRAILYNQDKIFSLLKEKKNG